MKVSISSFLILLVCGHEGLIYAEAKKNECHSGTYRHQTAPWKQGCPGFRVCEKGHYCASMTRYICPGGTFSNAEGLQTAQCSGQCPAGYYCPAGTISPIANKCSQGQFCPSGSSYPTLIPDGYVGKGGDSETRDAIDVCPRGFYCRGGVQFVCPGGTNGEATGLSDESCSGVCPMGWFCPPGTVQPNSNPCGHSPTSYCPAGSPSPVTTTLGFYTIDSTYDFGGGYGGEAVCPPGSYCLGGERHLCAGGRWGATKQSTRRECDGVCAQGWFCPAGSILSTQHPCGGPHVYCPPSSAAPLLVSRGHYTTGSNEDANATIDVDNESYLAVTRGQQAECEAGYYCTEGVKHACPSGYYGNSSGAHTAMCSGQCDQGYFCPAGSTSPREMQCGSNGVFCPLGSKEPQSVAVGHYTVGGGIATHYAERLCEPGHYCVNGTKHFCVSGRYGAEFGQTDGQCSGGCEEGYYCPEGSTTAREVQCGGASWYCPAASSRPLAVPPGHYSTGGSVSTRSAYTAATRGRFASGGLNYLCPAGRFGTREAESDAMCSGPCLQGFYCPAGSVSPMMRVCGGDDVICPPSSASPVAVHTGFFTTFEWEEGCKPGTWRNTLLAFDPSVPGNSFLPTSEISSPCELCPEGHYKILRGDSADLCLPCPLAESNALDDRTGCECYRAPGGKFLESDEFLHFNHTIGVCEVKQASNLPYLVDGVGWSLNTSVNRVKEYECLAGHFCVEGVQYPCPETRCVQSLSPCLFVVLTSCCRYGDTTRQTHSLCTGDCPQGYYCPRGTSFPRTNICGASYLYCPQGECIPSRPIASLDIT